MADQNEIEEWRDIFSNYDKTGGGKVPCAAVGEILRVLGQNPTEEEVSKILKEIDPDGEKDVSFEEFLPLLTNQRKKVGGNADFASFCEGLKMFDRENNGMASVAEIRNILVSMGEPLTGPDVDTLMEGVGDNNGQLNYEEFIRAVMDN